MRRSTLAVTAAWALAAPLAADLLHAQEPSLRPAAGRLLVARRDLPDPNFAASVVLLIRADEEGSMGLLINRPSQIPLARVFDELSGARERKDPVFWGGPVARGTVFALLRAKDSPPGAQRVLPEVHLISTRELLEKQVLDGAPAERFRVYLGYCGWGPGQLEREMEWGAWHVFRADAGLVFDAAPEAVWPRLIQRTELQLAGWRESATLPLLRRPREPLWPRQ